MKIKICFDPIQAGYTDIFNDEVARKFYLLWRNGHIVDQHFHEHVIPIANEICKLEELNAKSLAECFPRIHSFVRADVERFCEKYWKYFDTVEYEIVS